MEFTKGVWSVKELPITRQPAVYVGTKLIAGGLTKANADLIVSAVNACIAVNPDNPIAVAESISDLYKACRNVYEAHWQGLPQLLESVIETMVKPAIAKAEKS